MTDAELLDRVRDLRETGRSPKEIARSLGLPPAAVVPLVRRVAQERPTPPGDATPELVGCWVSPGWSRGLSVEGHPDWRGRAGERPERGGMVAVLVARRRRGGQSLCVRLPGEPELHAGEDGSTMALMTRRASKAPSWTPRALEAPIVARSTTAAAGFADARSVRHEAGAGDASEG
jgi:hypothetical protein